MQQFHSADPVDQALVGNSARMREIRNEIRQLGPVPFTVHLTGPTGSGKTLAARLLHEVSDRRTGPFEVRSMGALADGLELAELFGHTRGAFTGAVTERKGAVRLADQGTLFLDEIGLASVTVQKALISILDNNAVQPVGSAHSQKVAVRFIVATNEDLQAEVEAGRFRDDLYHRLGSFEIRMPALRERMEDLPLLARSIMVRLHEASGLPLVEITASQMRAMESYSWPGNVRELQKAMEYLLVRHRLPDSIYAGDPDQEARRQTAVELVGEVGVTETARRMRVTRQTVYRWQRDAEVAG